MTPASFNFAAVFARHAREQTLADREESGETRDTARRTTDTRRDRQPRSDRQPTAKPQN